jgi:hypothetical protein
MRSSAPPAVISRQIGRRSRHSPGSHPSAFPPRSFTDPRGLDPCRPLRPCFMPLPLLGFRPSERFPPAEPAAARRRALPSRCSLRPRWKTAAPPGVFVGQESVSAGGVFHPDGRPLLSWAFIASTAFLRSGVEASFDDSSARDLVSGAVLARLGSGSSASSCPAPGVFRSRGCQPS